MVKRGFCVTEDIRIEDLADKADFLEVSYFLIFGELPTAAQLEKFENDIRKYTLVSEEMKSIIAGFPRTAHPMGVLASLTSALTAFNPKSVNPFTTKKKCMKLFVKQWLNF